MEQPAEPQIIREALLADDRIEIEAVGWDVLAKAKADIRDGFQASLRHLMDAPRVAASADSGRRYGRRRKAKPSRKHRSAGKYTPHQGQRECARRIRQMAQAAS